jgi:tellurium resistance protein TerZ
MQQTKTDQKQYYCKLQITKLQHTKDERFMAVNLNKGSSLSLQKADGSALTLVRLGLGWDALPKKGLFGRSSGGDVDLDASAIMFNAAKKEVGIVSFAKLRSQDGSITHSGDNLTGAGDGDDEQITVDLARVPADVQSIVFVITSYSSHRFDGLSNVFARVVDLSNGESEVARYNLAEKGTNTASVIAKLSREGSGWKVTAVGAPANGKTAKAVLNEATAVA